MDGDWSSFVQTLGTAAANYYTADQAGKRAYEVQQLQLQQAAMQQATAAQAAAASAIKPSTILIGAALVGVALFLSDRKG